MSRLPTQRRDVRVTARTVRLVLGSPLYAAIALLVAAVGLTLFVVSQNLTLVADLVVGGDLPLSDRLVVLSQLYPFVGTIYGPTDSVAILIVAALMGVNLAMVTYHLTEHDLSAAESSGSLAGVALGALGAGCAACGSAVLLGVLSFFGASGLVFLLPLGGLEITLLAVVALLLSTYWLADGMRGGEVRGCPIDV